MVEWFKALVLKTSVSARAPWVRIPPPPLLLKIKRSQLVLLENHKHFFIGNTGFLKLDLFLPDSDCSIKNKNVFGLCLGSDNYVFGFLEVFGYLKVMETYF